MIDSGFYVIDRDGKRWSNLVGVFGRVFAIAAGNAKHGTPTRVTYHGEDFTLCPSSNDETKYDED